MPGIQKMDPLPRRPVLVMNGKIYRRWTGSIPRKTDKYSIPDALSAVMGSASDGPAVITIDNNLPVMKPGSRHLTRFWFKGSQVKFTRSKTGRLIVCIQGTYTSLEPIIEIDP